MSGFLRAGLKNKVQVTTFRRAQGPFPAVAEHIIPKGDFSVGKAWQVDVHEECSGLLLLR